MVAVIVRTRKEHRRRTQLSIRFDCNAAVCFVEGRRRTHRHARSLGWWRERERKFMKIISLAPEVL